MIGLVNAVGTQVIARTESVERAARERVAEPQTNMAPILGAEAAAYHVLNTAIKAMDGLFGTTPERHMPSGEESDRFAQAETEKGTSTLSVGANLDVTA